MGAVAQLQHVLQLSLSCLNATLLMDNASLTTPTISMRRDPGPQAALQ